VQTSTTSLTIVLRLESVHRQMLTLLGLLYEKIYNPSGLNCGMWVRTHVIPMCMDAQHTKHVTYKLAYHFVWCPKYRKKILVGKLATFLEQEIRCICETNTWTSLSTQCPD
jgi:transposase IS200 family protein